MTLHSHMRMTGAWHLYRPGERWRQPERYATVVLTFEDTVAVCFKAPVMELVVDERLPVASLKFGPLERHLSVEWQIATSRLELR